MELESAKYIAVGITIIPLFGVALAIGNIFSNAISSIARNPGVRKEILPVTMLGFALAEAIALFALLVVFLILFG